MRNRSFSSRSRVISSSARRSRAANVASRAASRSALRDQTPIEAASSSRSASASGRCATSWWYENGSPARRRCAGKVRAVRRQFRTVLAPRPRPSAVSRNAASPNAAAPATAQSASSHARSERAATSASPPRIHASRPAAAHVVGSFMRHHCGSEGGDYVKSGQKIIMNPRHVRRRTIRYPVESIGNVEKFLARMRAREAWAVI